MAAEITAQLKIFDAQKVYSEMRFLKSDVIDRDTLSMCQGVLTLLGYKRQVTCAAFARTAAKRGSPQCIQGQPARRRHTSR